MSRKTKETEVTAVSFKNDSVRQRWELFHRAIAYAKQSNLESLDEAEAASGEPDRNAPLLTLVR